MHNEPSMLDPPEEACCPEGSCARFNTSMYGARDARTTWESVYADALVSLGVVQGVASQGCFKHMAWGAEVVVQGGCYRPGHR